MPSPAESIQPVLVVAKASKALKVTLSLENAIWVMVSGAVAVAVSARLTDCVFTAAAPAAMFTVPLI